MTAAPRHAFPTMNVPLTRLLTEPSGGQLLDDGLVVYEATGLVEACMLASLVFDNRRTYPLIVATAGYRGFIAFDTKALARRLNCKARLVTVCDVETVRALCVALPAQLSVFDGRIRVFQIGRASCRERVCTIV